MSGNAKDRRRARRNLQRQIQCSIRDILLPEVSGAVGQTLRLLRILERGEDGVKPPRWAYKSTSVARLTLEMGDAVIERHSRIAVPIAEVRQEEP